MAADSSRAVFLSYASQDTELALRLCEALRAASVEVWFDQFELTGGDAWDAKIRRQIRDCALFVPLISANTQTRLEGYFRLEWKLAEDRSHLIAKGKPFLLPVAVDGVTDRDAAVPDAFLTVQWVRLERQGPLDRFVTQVQRALATPGTASLRSGTAPAPRGESPAPAAGTPSIPDYELVRPIGRGAYGEVWLARGVTGAWRAVKIVWRERFADAEPFEREFRGVKEAMSLPLAETGALTLHHVGRDDRAGFFYYVMELADDALRGRDVEPTQYVPLTLKHLRAERRRLPAKECVALASELARGLAALHARGLVHRDIKPSNVVLVGGRPKLADIGLVAKGADAHTFVGTEGFVPPEGPGSPAADVFALGRVLYELATGFDRSDYPKLPDTFADTAERTAFFTFNEILLRAGDPDPKRRYKDAQALLADLEKRYATGSVAAPASATSPSGTWLAAGLAAAVVVSAGVWWLIGSKPRDTVHAPVSAAAQASPPAGPKSGAPAAAQTPAPVAAVEGKTLVVLPLEFAVAEAEAAELADTLHDTLVQTLSRESGLTVKSKTSSLSFKGTALPLAEIGRKIDAAYAVAGSVRKTGAKWQAQLELRRTSDEAQFWQNAYTFEANDPTWAVTVADQVSRFIQAREAKGSWAGARFLTKNAEALELFMKAKVQHGVNPGGLGAAFEEQIRLLKRALELDPNFMYAANLLSISYCYARPNPEAEPAKHAEFAVEARRYAEISSRLTPGGAGDGAWAVYYATFERAPARSRIYAENEVRALPNDANSHNRLAANLANSGRFSEAMASYERALELDPGNFRTLHNWTIFLAALRRLPEFEAAATRTISVYGEQTMGPYNYAAYHYRLTGEIPPSEVLADAGTKLPPALKSFFYFVDRKFEESVKVTQSLLASPNLSDSRRFTLLLQREWTRSVAGRRDTPEPELNELFALIEKLKPAPEADQSEHHYRRMRVLQLANRQHEAIAMAKRYLEALPAGAQVVERWLRESEVAELYALCGRAKESVEILARLLRLPSGVTIPALRRSPVWDRIREDPGFKALLTDPKNSEPL